MRTAVITALASAALISSAASAQSAHEVRKDQREVAKDQAKTGQDLARGKFKAANKEVRETREDQKELRNDWQDYRKAHRDAFHRPAYKAPRGHSYRRVGVGAMLNRAFWGSSYRIANYQTYRLPGPGANRAYVRYGNDVLLVDLRTGRVIEVFNNFFW